MSDAASRLAKTAAALADELGEREIRAVEDLDDVATFDELCLYACGQLLFASQLLRPKRTDIMADAVALAEVLAEREFPKGTKLGGPGSRHLSAGQVLVREPGRRPYVLGPWKGCD